MSITLETLLPIQDDRDELVQLLNAIGTEWHEHEEAFEHRTLAEWPKWCEGQGFRFEVLHNLACNLEDALNDPEGSEGIKQCIAALGPAATAPQLLLSLSQQLPQFLEAFDQLLQISQEESHELGSQAGGTSKQWIKDHPGVDAAASVLLVGGGIGFAIQRRYVRARQQEVDEVEEQEQILEDGVEERAEERVVDGQPQIADWDNDAARQAANWQWRQGAGNRDIAIFEEAIEDVDANMGFIEHRVANRALIALGADAQQRLDPVDSLLIRPVEELVEANFESEAMTEVRSVEGAIVEDIDKRVEALLANEVKSVELNIEESIVPEIVASEERIVDA